MQVVRWNGQKLSRVEDSEDSSECEGACECVYHCAESATSKASKV